MNTEFSAVSRKQKLQPTGFTLLEVLLVLSLMVVVASIAAVELRGGIRHQRLAKAAEQVRLSWAQARVKAIKTGRIHVFYHAVNQDQYLVTPQQSLDDPTMGLQSSAATGMTNTTSTSTSVNNSRFGSAAGNGAAVGSGTTNGLAYAVDPRSVVRRKLPEGVSFLAADIQLDQRSVLQLNTAPDPTAFNQNQFGSASDGNEATNGSMGFGDTPLSAQQWGMPIFFFPDGTSSSARMMLQNDRQQMVIVYLRGLTGLARVGDVQALNAQNMQGIW